MRWIERFDLFLLDLDGLLVDTERLHFQAYQTLCQRHGCTLPWDFLNYLQIAHSSSQGLQNGIYALFPQLEEKGDWTQFYLEKKKIYLEILREKKPSFLPGVESFLKELRRAHIKRCVVTHSPKEQVEEIKFALPLLKTIPVWITREDYENPKPAPDGYLKAIEILADPDDRIVGFEDSFRGLQALQQTSALPVLICDPAHPQVKELKKDQLFFPSFDQITLRKSL